MFVFECNALVEGFFRSPPDKPGQKEHPGRISEITA